jgi:hypothetical protein
MASLPLPSTNIALKLKVMCEATDYSGLLSEDVFIIILLIINCDLVDCFIN